LLGVDVGTTAVFVGVLVGVPVGATPVGVMVGGTPVGVRVGGTLVGVAVPGTLVGVLVGVDSPNGPNGANCIRDVLCDGAKPATAGRLNPGQPCTTRPKTNNRITTRTMRFIAHSFLRTQYHVIMPLDCTPVKEASSGSPLTTPGWCTCHIINTSSSPVDLHVR
jgi:hypothetical protein